MAPASKTNMGDVSSKNDIVSQSLPLPYGFWLTVGGCGAPPDWQKFVCMARRRVQQGKAETALKEARREAKKEYEKEWAKSGQYGFLLQRRRSKELKAWHEGYLAERSREA